jgi:hypothetical protein
VRKVVHRAKSAAFGDRQTKLLPGVKLPSFLCVRHFSNLVSYFCFASTPYSIGSVEREAGSWSESPTFGVPATKLMENTDVSAAAPAANRFVIFDRDRDLSGYGAFRIDVAVMERGPECDVGSLCVT